MFQVVFKNSHHPGCQRLFMCGFWFLSSLYSDRRANIVLALACVAWQFCRAQY